MRLVELLGALAAGLLLAIAVRVGDEPARADVEFRFTDPEIVESSGLVTRDGRFATVNDSGDSGRVFVVDPATGDTTGVVSWPGDPVDVEALAPQPGEGLLVGDIGDNAAGRESVSLHEVPFAGEGAELGEPTTYRLRYPESPRDAESLLVHPRTGRVMVASKGVLSGTLYAAPKRLEASGVNRLRAVADLPGTLTDGAFFPDGRHLALRDYGQMYVYSYPEMERMGTVELPDQEQGEGLAIDERGDVFVSTEGVNTPVHRVPLPPRITAAMRPSQPTTSPGEHPTASREQQPTAAPAPTPGEEEPAVDEPVGSDRRLWTWLLGAGIGLVLLVVLLRSLRPR